MPTTTKKQAAKPKETTLDRAHAAITEAPHTAAQLVEELGVNRNTVQKAITQLREAELIHVIGKGYAGAEIWALMDVPADPGYYTRTRLGADTYAGAKVVAATDHPATRGMLPGQFDKLVVTETGLMNGQPVIKLQRADGTTWIMARVASGVAA